MVRQGTSGLSQEVEHWDKQGLQKSLGAMSSLLPGLVDAFIESMQQRHQQLVTAMQASDLQTLLVLAHSIKGSAAQMYCHRLVDVARQVEFACADDSGVNNGPLIEDMLSTLIDTLALMQEHRHATN